MGREAEGSARWRGTAGAVKALLEGTEIILRGDVRARIPRLGLGLARTDGDDLTIPTPDGPLILTLGAKEATVWAAALSKPPPSLADKLGVGPDRAAFATGDLSDPALAALGAAVVDDPARVSILLAVLATHHDLAGALALARAHPALPIWCIYPKGRNADPGDAAVRAVFRAAGWIDTKTSAVSDRLTATRYGRARQA